MKEANKLYDKILESVIQETDFQFLCSNNSTNGISTTLKEDLKSSRKNRSNGSRRNTQKFNGHYHFEKIFFELLILQHESLWIIFTRAFHLEEYEYKAKGREKMKLVNFLYILTNQINNLNSILHLIKSGYSLNADRIFRNYIELSEKSLAILFDDNHFEDFQKDPSSRKEEMNKWHRQKPSKTFQLVKEFLSTLNNDDFYDLFFKIREKLYHHKSRIVHSDFESVLKGSLGFDKNTGLLHLYLHGNIDSTISHNLNDYLVYIKIITQAQTIILVKDYKLHFEKFDQDGIYYVFLNALTDKLFRVYLKIYQYKIE